MSTERSRKPFRGLPGFICAAIVGALQPGVWSEAAAAQSPAPADPRQRNQPQDEEARRLFAQAQDLLGRSDPRTGGSFANARQALDLYQRVLDREPRFALAHVQMARAWMVQGYSNPDAPPSDQIAARARAAANRAVEVDPDLPEAHALLAQIYYLSDYDWAAAEREYRWAIERDPDNGSARAGLAAFLGTMGRFDEALEQARAAERLRQSPADAFTIARIYYSMRNYDAAVEHCRRALASQDNQAYRFYLGLMLMAQGRPAEGVAELERAAAMGDNAGATLGLAYGYAQTGRRDEALRLLDGLRANRPMDQVVPYRQAAVHLALGDRAEAIRQLQRDYDGRGNWMVQLKVDPVMDPLRSDPAFQELMRRMRFM